MCSCTWRVCHLSLTLTALACCGWLLYRDSSRSGVSPPAPNSEQAVPNLQRPTLSADDALRSFLNVQSASGDFELPEHEKYGVIAILHFENGKFHGRRGACMLTDSPNTSRVVAYQILWGQEPGGGTHVVVMTHTPGITSTCLWGKGEGNFLSKVGHASMQSAAATEEVRGYRVIYHSVSHEIRPGKPGVVGRASEDIQNRQTVAVFGVKTFPTYDEASNWLSQKEPADL